LMIPYFGIPDFVRWKLYPPVGDMRYYQEKGTANHFYILPPILKILTDIREKLCFVEGEKKTAAGVQRGLKAIGFSGIWCWKETDDWRGTLEELALVPFSCRDVEIIPDSDTWIRDDLQHAIYAFARYVASRGANVKVVIIPQPQYDKKVGLDDYLLDHTIDEFHHLNRIDLKHKTLSQHKDWYDHWKAKKSPEDDDPADGLQGKRLNLGNPDPWPDPVNGSELLAGLAAAFRRFVILPPHAENVQALWVLHAHAIDAFGISPILEINAPDSDCGKTINQSVARRLVPRALTTTSITVSGIFRIVEKIQPTFCIDEADTFLKLHEDLRGVLNSSHFRNDAFVVRVEGDNHEPRAFSTWCAKSIALIGNLPATLRSRAITIQMKRKLAEDKVDDFHGHLPYPELEDLKRKAWRWAQDNIKAIREANPSLPVGIINRNRNNWFPLFAIAEIAGGEWPDKCRAALLAFEKTKLEDESQRIVLLGDMRVIFEDRKNEGISTEDLLKLLGEMDERPWPEWNRGKPITAVQLSRILKPFGIRPKTIRVGIKTFKGYDFADCTDAFKRYLPRRRQNNDDEEPEPPHSEPSHPSQTNEFNNLGTFSEPSQGGNVTGQKSGLSSEKQKNVTGVTAQHRGVNGNSHDADEFAWINYQREGETVDEFWIRIKAQHAAKRAAGR
jgi:Protein of unknown function (DUF3631)/Domain of unknown function (DUF3854)